MWDLFLTRETLPTFPLERIWTVQNKQHTFWQSIDSVLYSLEDWPRVTLRKFLAKSRTLDLGDERQGC